tara:strand:+ start:229 stop:531 length:303 start_codon:yes stop_codon:yes gene_type:complete
MSVTKMQLYDSPVSEARAVAGAIYLYEKQLTEMETARDALLASQEYFAEVNISSEARLWDDGFLNTIQSQIEQCKARIKSLSQYMGTIERPTVLHTGEVV